MMRLAILALLTSAACFGCGGNGFASCATITFDHTKVQSTDQANFPSLITGTYTFLKTTTNGGFVTNANGFDVVFTSDAGCATYLDWEVENWDGSTGIVYYWVRVPTLSHTVDTLIYMCAGKSSITTDQSNKTGVWDSNFLGVFHMNTASGSFTQSDSTANNNQMTGQSGAQVSRVAGIISGAQNDNATQRWLGSGSAGYPSGSSLTFTMETWAKFDNSSIGTLMSFNTGSTSSGTALAIRSDDSKLSMDVLNSSRDTGNVLGGDTTHFFHIVLTCAGASSTCVFYVNGSSVSSTGTPSYNIGANAHPTMWTFVPFTINDPWSGTLDESRFSNVARSADWIKTEYNNQSSPATFFTLSQTSFTPTQIGGFLTGP